MREIYSSFSRFLLPKLRINYESKSCLFDYCKIKYLTQEKSIAYWFRHVPTYFLCMHQAMAHTLDFKTTEFQKNCYHSSNSNFRERFGIFSITTFLSRALKLPIIVLHLKKNGKISVRRNLQRQTQRIGFAKLQTSKQYRTALKMTF